MRKNPGINDLISEWQIRVQRWENTAAASRADLFEARVLRASASAVRECLADLHQVLADATELDDPPGRLSVPR